MTEASPAGQYDEAAMSAPADSSTTEQRIARLTQLTLPATALYCIENFCGDGLDATQFCKVVSQDPALTARLIGIANSAFFALPRPVFVLETAILSVLGLDFARSLSLSMALSGCFKADRCSGFDLERYWATALLQTSFATKLAPRGTSEATDRSAIPLAALLRSLGLLVLAHVHPTGCSAALLSRGQDAGLGTVLRRHCGLDHHQTLQLLLPRWGLAELLPLLHDALAPVRAVAAGDQRATTGALTVRFAHLAAEAFWAQPEDWDGHFPDAPGWLSETLRADLVEEAHRRMGVVAELLSVTAL